MYHHADKHVDSIIRDGGVIDVFSLLAGSALPEIIAEGAEGAEGADSNDEDRDRRRVRAERTLVT